MSQLKRVAVGGLYAVSVAWCAPALSAFVQVATVSPQFEPLGVDNLVEPKHNKLPDATLVRIQGRPAWHDLSLSQQQSLKPLAGTWNTLGDAQKRKWIRLAADYPRLSPVEQDKMHSRMSDWAALSPQQRSLARLNFAETKQVDAGKKAATWQAYQALSAEEKQKLAVSASPKPLGVATMKPSSSQKLVLSTDANSLPKHMPRVAASGHALDRHTLLPLPPAPSDAAALQKN